MCCCAEVLRFIELPVKVNSGEWRVSSGKSCTTGRQ